MVIILMGVSGAGKTTIGQKLAQALGWRFLDGDDVHSPSSVAKMASGQALTDEDRKPWLETLRQAIAQALAQGEHLVLACSALKQSYREQLTVDAAQVRWVYLWAPREVLARRLAQRKGHFMPPSLLGSQLETLEAPADALKVDVTPGPAQVVEHLRTALGL